MPLEVPSDRPEGDLRQRGYRLTPQRERILRIFRDLPYGTHLSAEDLYQRLAAEEPKISLATAYRTLKLLASLGHLREVDFAEGHKHYEYHREGTPHQHITCQVCGATHEFAAEELDAATRSVALHLGFSVTSMQIHLVGVCGSCRAVRGMP